MLPRGKLRGIDCITRGYCHDPANRNGFFSVFLRAKIDQLRASVATWQQAPRAMLKKGN